MAIDREETLRRAEKLYRQGRLEPAIAEYQRVVDEHPRDWTTANTLGDLFQRANQPEKARAQFTRIADHFASEGFLPKAAAIYKKILKIRPDDEHALQQSADIAVRQGVLVEARQFLAALADVRRARGDSRGAAELLLRIGTLDPADFDARLSAARAAAAAGTVDLAVTELRAIADAYEAEGKPEPALHVLAEALRLSPGDADLRLRIGRAYAARGDVAGTRAHGTTADECRELADLLALHGHDDASLELMAETLRLDPGDALTAARLVQGYASRGDHERARTYVDALGEPDDAGLALLAGELLARSGETERARSLLARGLAREPHRTTPLVELAVSLAPAEVEAAFACVDSAVGALVTRGDYRGAVAAYQAFVQTRPDYLPALQRLVEICVDGGLESDMLVAQAELAEAYLAAGRGPEARLLAEDLVSRQPTNEQHAGRLGRALTLCGESEVEAIVAARVATALSDDAEVGSLDLTDEPTSAGSADAPPGHRSSASAAPAAPSDDHDPFRLGPIAIDLSDILGEDGSGTVAAAGASEIEEIDLSGALEDLRATETPAPSRAESSLDEVFKEFREEVSRESQADAAEQRFKLALAYRDMGMVDEALKELRVAVRAPRLRFEAALSIARLLVGRGAQAQAVEWFERAAEAPAPSVEAGRELLYDLGATLEALGETSRALAVFLELQSDAGDYRDLATRIGRLSRVQAEG